MAPICLFEVLQHDLQLTFFSAHADGFAVRHFVVVAQQVQNPVNEQGAQFGGKGPFAVPGLAVGGVDRDDDIAQKSRTNFVGQRKRQHVRWPVFIPILTVQLMDRLIRHEGQTQLGLLQLQVTQDRSAPASNPGPAQARDCAADVYGQTGPGGGCGGVPGFLGCGVLGLLGRVHRQQ